VPDPIKQLNSGVHGEEFDRQGVWTVCVEKASLLGENSSFAEYQSFSPKEMSCGPVPVGRFQ